MDTAGMVKVRVEAGEPWPNGATETLWAEPVQDGGDEADDGNAAGHGDGSKPGRFRLPNSPFLVRDLSHLDVVEATPTGDSIEGTPVYAFTRVVERGGHSTYHVLLARQATNPDEVRRLMQPLTDIGCTFEGMGMRLLAVDVPPAVDLEAVLQCLKEVEMLGHWSFEEAHCGRGEGSPA
jgi:hypothetical protein